MRGARPFLRGSIVRPHEIPNATGSVKPAGKKKRLGYFTTGAIEFGDIAARRKVERVYVGHIHALGYANHKNVRYVLSGGGGSPLYDFPNIPGEKTAHYILVEAGPQGVLDRIVTLQGEELRFALSGPSK